MTRKTKLIYLLAASHSCSTLTAMLLGAHPALSCIGELKANRLGDVNKYLCSCQERISDCDFWNSINAQTARRGIDFSIADAQTDIRSNANKFQQRLLSTVVRNKIWEVGRDAAPSSHMVFIIDRLAVNKTIRYLSCVFSAVTAKALVQPCKSTSHRFAACIDQYIALA